MISEKEEWKASQSAEESSESEWKQELALL